MTPVLRPSRSTAGYRSRRARWHSVASKRWAVGVNAKPPQARWAAMVGLAVVMVQTWGWDRVPKEDLF